MGFLIGLIFFGDPLIKRGITYLNRKFPHWQKIFQLQKQVLEFISQGPAS